MTNIPAIMGMPKGSIDTIKIINNAKAINVGNIHTLNCIVQVKWVNGHTDYGAMFRMWINRYGQTMVSYKP